MFTVCGPEIESCVGNQTLKGKMCLLPCNGLYADIWDHSLMRTDMMTGRILVYFEYWTSDISGFHMLTQELSQEGLSPWKSGSQERLQQLFATSTKEEVDGVKSFTKSYHKYKRDYVEHFSFDPDEENLGKCILDYPSSFVSSLCAGACAIRGSVHFLRHSNLWWDWKGWEGELL